MNALEPLFARLARSTFRSRFRLGIKERQYCWDAAVDRHISHVLKCLFSYNIHLVVFFSTPFSTVQKNVLQGREPVYRQKLATLIWITFNDSAFSPAEDNHDR